MPVRFHTSCFAAADRQRADLLKGVAPDNRIAVSRAIEQAERAAAQWVLAFSDFLAPPAAAEALQCIERLSGVSGLPWGGYAQVCTGCRCLPRAAGRLFANRGSLGAAAWSLRCQSLSGAVTSLCKKTALQRGLWLSGVGCVVGACRQPSHPERCQPLRRRSAHG